MTSSKFLGKLQIVLSPLLRYILQSVAAFFMLVFGVPSHAVEEPDYQVLKTLSDKVELRQYAPYMVAQTLIPAGAAASGDAGNKAFPILAGYIFGKNKGSLKIDMTAPVTETAAPPAPTKIAMTAPVTQTDAKDGGKLVQFVLPKDITLANAPEPTDPRVELRQVPAQKWAVIRYSGTWSDANYEKHLQILKTTLQKENIATQGDPVFSRYNDPFTLWFNRRNEIWLAVAK